jgi:hypothetical protein
MVIPYNLSNNRRVIWHHRLSYLLPLLHCRQSPGKNLFMRLLIYITRFYSSLYLSIQPFRHVTFDDVEDMHVHFRGWEITAKVLSARTIQTRRSGRFLRAILADTRVGSFARPILLFTIKVSELTNYLRHELALFYRGQKWRRSRMKSSWIVSITSYK